MIVGQDICRCSLFPSRWSIHKSGEERFKYPLPPPGEQDQCKSPSPPGPTLAGFKLIGLANINVHFLQIEMESQKNTTTNLERISADLKQMKDENNTLAKKLKAAKWESWYFCIK